MSESTTPQSKSTLAKRSAWFQALWHGHKKPQAGWRALLGGILALTVAWFLFVIGGATIRWALPLKLVGVVAFLLAAGSLIWGLRAFLWILIQLGIKRLLIRFAIGYLIAVIITGLVVQTNETGSTHWIASAVKVTSWIGGGISGIAQTVVHVPDTITFAATGRRQPVRIPGVEWVGNVPPTPIVANGAMDVSTSGNPITSIPVDLQIGDTIQVIGTGGASLNARSIPGGSGQIMGKFRSGETLQIIDGPQSVDERNWWKVSNGTTEGWCAAEYLGHAP